MESPVKSPAPSVMKSKVLSLSTLAEFVEKMKAKGNVVVHCHGVFDLLHPGHIRYFEAAKREGDVLIVTVTPDRFVAKGPGRPVFPEHLRAESLGALASVDAVAINAWPRASEAIRFLKPDVYAKGSEYEKPEDDPTGGILDEAAAIRDMGGRMHFTHEITFSSTKILNEHFASLAPELREYLAAFKQRHGATDIINRLQALREMKVVVIGDTIIDEYHSCAVLGRPTKSACLNTRFLQTEAFAGGVLAVANHLAGFCGDVHLVSVLGEEPSHLPFIEQHLKPNISTKFFTCPARPTTVKRRFVEPFKYQKMFEVTFIDDRPLPPVVAEPLRTYLADILPAYDLAVVADFGHSMLGNELARLISERSRFLALNAQTNSTNLGFNTVRKYPRAGYVCLDQEEMRLAYHDRFGSLENLLTRTVKDFSADVITVTRGYHGSTTAKKGTMIETPVFSTEVVDTIGAGDAYFSVTAPCAAAGEDPDAIGFIGNAVGALAIRIVGNRESIEPVALYKYITTLLK